MFVHCSRLECASESEVRHSCLLRSLFWKVLIANVTSKLGKLDKGDQG